MPNSVRGGVNKTLSISDECAKLLTNQQVLYAKLLLVIANLPLGMIKEREKYEIEKNEQQTAGGSPCIGYAF